MKRHSKAFFLIDTCHRTRTCDVHFLYDKPAFEVFAIYIVVVTKPRLENLKKQVQSLMQHQVIHYVSSLTPPETHEISPKQALRRGHLCDVKLHHFSISNYVVFLRITSFPTSNHVIFLLLMTSFFYFESRHFYTSNYVIFLFLSLTPFSEMPEDNALSFGVFYRLVLSRSSTYVLMSF